MRILIYGLNFRPELTSTGKYTGELAHWLAKKGHDIKVITAPPYYPYWKVQEPYRCYRYERERLDGMDVYRCPIWVPTRPTGLKRVLHLLSFALSSVPVFVRLLFWRPEVIFVVEPSFFNALLVALAKPFTRAKRWLHVQDFEMEAAFSLGLVKGNLLLNPLRKLEKSVMSRFDRVSTISPSMLEQLAHKGVDPLRTTLLANWLDPVQTAVLPASLRADWNIPATAKIVLYAGNLGKKQGLEGLLNLAKELKEDRPEILFLLVGDGTVKSELQKIASKDHLMNVWFFPVQPTGIFPALLKMADVHLILQLRGASAWVMPSKLATILASGGAVLATADPNTELHRIIEGNELGVVVEPESAPALRQGLLRLLDDPQKRSRLGERAKKYAAEHLNKDRILNQFEQQLAALLSR